MGTVYKRLKGCPTRPNYIWVEGSKGAWIYLNKPTALSTLNWERRTDSTSFKSRFVLEHEDVTLELAEVIVKVL